jgi:carbamoyl-phosphate synthase large subunit
MNNKTVKILVTGIGGDIGMGIIRCLQEIKYHSFLLGCDINKYPAGKNFVDDFFIAPSALYKENYIISIMDMCKKHNINFLIPSTEQEIKVIDENRNLFKAFNINILINNKYIIDTFMDKDKTIEFFNNNGFLYPRTYSINEYKGELKYPFIMKLKETRGGKGVFIINDKLDFEYYKSRYENSIIQEIIGNIDEEYTIGVFSDGSKTYNIAFRRYLGFGSLSRYVELIKDNHIDLLANNISNATKLIGCFNIQVRKDKSGNYIPFEINPRLSSTIYFRNFFGFTDLKWWLDLYLGNEIKYTLKYSKGIGIRTLNEVFFELEQSEGKI